VDSLIISILLPLLFGYSHCQNKTDIIQDSFCGNPFILEKPDIQLPDSLGGKNLNGLAILVLTIDSSKAILKYRVVRFKAAHIKNKIKIDFYHPNKKDAVKIKRYKKWLDNYVKRIVIKANTQYTGLIGQKYNIYLTIMFNQDTIK
jgi:hypothetical protein